MEEINSSFALNSKPVTVSKKENNSPKSANFKTYTATQMNLEDEFVAQHKKNGLFERLINGLKNLTGIGIGSKKIRKQIQAVNNGEISEDDVHANIDKYRKSQANSAQVLGDAVSIGASAGAFFTLNKFLKFQQSKWFIKGENVPKVNIGNGNKFFGKSVNKVGQFITDKFFKILKSDKKLLIFMGCVAAVVGAVTKRLTLKLNRVGSKQFKLDKKDYNNLETEQDKKLYKKDKKINKKARRKFNRRNRLSGAINGLLLPICFLGNGIVGVPVYLLLNTLNRYFIGNTEEKNKSFKGYLKNLKDNPILPSLLAIGASIPLIKKGRWSLEYNKNLKNVTAKLKGAKLEFADFTGCQSSYRELEDCLMNSKSIREITDGIDEYNKDVNISEVIKKLTDENIFAVKFQQIKSDGSLLTSELKQNCPPTLCTKGADGKFDFSKVQSIIDKKLTKKYTISKCLGVGTVAETYLAKGPDGKEVCIKILKEGIDGDKITKDYKKFVEIIKTSEKSAEEKDYLLRNLKDMYEHLLEEVDFGNELRAAEELAKYTKAANVVKPIALENGVYIMEKADGISLDSLINLNALYSMKKSFSLKHKFADDMRLEIEYSNARLRELLRHAETDEEKIKIIDSEIQRIKDKTPQFENLELNSKEMKYMLKELSFVFAEQFNKVDKNGKIIHGDPHLGNMFVDMNVIKKEAAKENIFTKIADMLNIRKPNSAKAFTFIDTGNTIKQSTGQAINYIRLSQYIEHGNINDITEYFLEGAKLPSGMTKEEAVQKVSEELKKYFFDNKTHLYKVSNESIMNDTSKIMRKYGIIPGDEQFNLNKAQTCANETYKTLFETLGTSIMANSQTETGLIKNLVSNVTAAEMTKRRIEVRQEKLNILHLDPIQRRKYKNNPNLLPKNSEDYLTYKMKQSI